MMKLILFVEDEYGNAEVLQMLLEAEGFRVVHASNGRDALALLAGEKPSVILSDFMMPHMTGGEFGLAVRAAPELKDIPFVLLSGTQEEVVRVTFKDYDAFVRKPYAAESLLTLLSHLSANGRPSPLPVPSGSDPRNADMDFSLRQLLRGIEIPPS
jgi:two-component system phosphate regulon response regulator PhoB